MRINCIGKVFEDIYGRVYFDTCETDREHMFAPVEEGQERRTCRIYVEELFQPLVGQTGVFSIDLHHTAGQGETMELRLPVSEEAIMEELNAISHFFGDRQKELEGTEKKEKNLAQVLALGALFFKHLQELPENERGVFIIIADNVADGLAEVVEVANGPKEELT